MFVLVFLWVLLLLLHSNEGWTEETIGVCCLREGGLFARDRAGLQKRIIIISSNNKTSTNQRVGNPWTHQWMQQPTLRSLFYGDVLPLPPRIGIDVARDGNAISASVTGQFCSCHEKMCFMSFIDCNFKSNAFLIIFGLLWVSLAFLVTVCSFTNSSPFICQFVVEASDCQGDPGCCGWNPDVSFELLRHMTKSAVS